MRVLLVEDHAELAETVAAGLRREGMAVDVAGDGHDALARADLVAYEVVVLDRDLPGLHGDGEGTVEPEPRISRISVRSSPRFTSPIPSCGITW